MDIWTEILSRDPARITLVFKQLNSSEKITVRAHLIKMTTEDGWHEGQINSAQIALDAINDLPDA
jgi:hypothetical protein